MAPAVHHQHYHHRQDTVTVTQIEHRGAQDVTLVYEIAARTSTSPHIAKDSLSLSTPSRLTLATLNSSSPEHLSTAALTSLTTTTTMTRNYPRPSPPTLFHLETIPPPHGDRHSMQQHAPQHSHPRFPPRSTQQACTMPSWLAILVFVIIAFAAVLSLVVCLIHHRGTTTGMKPASETQREGRKQGGWRAYLASGMACWTKGRDRGRGRGYEVLGSGDPVLDADGASNAALSSARDVAEESPVNPYLVASDRRLKGSVRVRGSGEWAEEHRAFFDSAAASKIPDLTPSRGSSLSDSSSSAELLDVESEAREAQGRLPSVHQGHSQAHSRSWVDAGLAAVDGAVDRFAAKIVRWADDNGRDEALILPLAKGKQD